MLKIVLIGPESTAKTTLAQALSKEFTGAFVEEYSRDYALQSNRDLCYEDVMPIVRGQLALEEKASATNPQVIFLDSNILASKVYSLWYYGKAPEELLRILSNKKYDFYLLCRPDIPWEADKARTMSLQADREDIFELFENELRAAQANYAVIQGLGEDRYRQATDLIKSLYPLALSKDL